MLKCKLVFLANGHLLSMATRIGGINYLVHSLFQICYKGSSTFKGYLKLEEETKEALDSDGWVHSGDIGRWLPNGALKIIDRKKSLIKLQQASFSAFVPLL